MFFTSSVFTVRRAADFYLFGERSRIKKKAHFGRNNSRAWVSYIHTYILTLLTGKMRFVLFYSDSRFLSSSSIFAFSDCFGKHFVFVSHYLGFNIQIQNHRLWNSWDDAAIEFRLYLIIMHHISNTFTMKCKYKIQG